MSPYAGKKSESIVGALAQANIIQEETATFCLYKLQSNATSTVSFGGVPDGCRKSDKTYSLKLNENNDHWWTARMRNLHYGDSSLKESSTQFAILDTGTSFIAISKTDYYNFAKKIM